MNSPRSTAAQERVADAYVSGRNDRVTTTRTRNLTAVDNVKSAGTCVRNERRQKRIGEVFDAMVTGASEKGTWVRIREPTVEGRVVKGFEGLDVGDPVRVKLIHTDIARGFIDFAIQR